MLYDNTTAEIPGNQLPRPDFDTVNLPVEGDDQAGFFFYSLFETAKMERDRLELPERWMANHQLYRGKHWGTINKLSQRDKDKLSINLFFANVIRTVANITARNPIAEVVILDGQNDGSDLLLSNKLKSWYMESEQQAVLYKSALNMEIYGITIEKSVFNADLNRTDTIVIDPFAFFPAPGYYEELNDCPYVCHAYPMTIEAAEKLFNCPGQIEADDVYSLLGEDREDNRPIPTGTRLGTQNYTGNYSTIQHPSALSPDLRERRALIVEIWIRDYSKIEVDVEVESVDPMTGQPVIVTQKESQYRYPGGIRVVTVTNRGRLVLSDRPNPYINPALPEEQSKLTYLWDHFPFFKSNSYEDTSSIWGFSAAEQTEDINKKINEVISRIGAYLSRITKPPLIVPLDCGIKDDEINNSPGLVLRPSNAVVAQGIRYLQVPNLPSNFFDVLNLYLSFHDRIYQIEDADRGEAPRGVIAASAIVALQERGAVLIRQKIRAIDYLVRERGRCAISNFQNFGVRQELIEVQGTSVPIMGIDLAGREYNYAVESGSTVARTSLQIQEQAMELYKAGAIDRQALLEALNFPNWKQIVERVGEGQLAGALQILVQAGLPEEQAAQLQQVLTQPQGGPGNAPQNPQNSGQHAATSTQPGTPMALQGQYPVEQEVPNATL